jgi:hypothetical protein
VQLKPPAIRIQCCMSIITIVAYGSLVMITHLAIVLLALRIHTDMQLCKQQQEHRNDSSV